MNGYKCLVGILCYLLAIGIEPATYLDDFI